ncbi:VQ motif-containing protein 4-like [Spinacia oleracea]|uniref:VQ motif-containing protein 4-like n=1 Tax=Spinacia oleracea TaxID=3562 RepID=A0A9R0I6N2_SPIOL|nr:VQ motif-containing protein 4-like [Spinacia oleracea]
MEITSKFKDRENNSPPLNSPTSCSTTQPPLPITRSDPNSPYPTTFVTADTSSFKQVVQMLTGSSEVTPKHNPKPPQQQQQQQQQNHHENHSRNYVIPPVKTAPKKQGFKLYERRNSIKNLISPLNAASANFTHQNPSFSPRYKTEILSPSLLDFPSLTLSPVTPLVEDPFNKSSPSIGGGSGGGGNCGGFAAEEEKKSMAEKGYYLHPSPISTPRDSQPQLLTLFPLSSPRVSDP